MNFMKLLTIINNLCVLCRTMQARLMQNHDMLSSELLLNSFYIKSIDLVDGIVKLYAAGLHECAQALIRVLFETNLKYMHYNILSQDNSCPELTMLVMDSMMIMKEKDAQLQDASTNNAYGFEKELKVITLIKQKYTEKQLVQIRRHGFCQLSIEALAKKYNKVVEYNIMYRNFSRNVHANDTAEYCNKQILESSDDHYDLRNSVAIEHAFETFFQMMIDMNIKYLLHEETNLNKLNKEFARIADK